MTDRRSGAKPTIVGSSVDWTRALMDQGFDGLGRLTGDQEDVRVCRERYDELRHQIDPVIRGAARVEFAIAVTRVDKSGRQGDALVVVTDAMVIVAGPHRGMVGVRSVVDLFSRRALTVLPCTFESQHAIELHADGRRLTLIFSRPSPVLEAALVALSEAEPR